VTTASTRQLPPDSAAKTNPPITPPTGSIRPAPRFHDVTDPDAYVATLAGAVAAEHPLPAVDFHDPRLTRGQAQLLRAEQPRLFRMLKVRDHRRLAKLAAVLELLEDLAEQAPAVDDALAFEDERRRSTAAARPRMGELLSKRGES
jgi:hypothetical protein